MEAIFLILQIRLTNCDFSNYPKQLTETLRNDMRECYLEHNAAALRAVICRSG